MNLVPNVLAKENGFLQCQRVSPNKALFAWRKKKIEGRKLIRKKLSGKKDSEFIFFIGIFG